MKQFPRRTGPTTRFSRKRSGQAVPLSDMRSDPDSLRSISLQIGHGLMNVGVVQIALPAHLGEQHDASSPDQARSNPELRFPLDDRPLPRPVLWSSISAPVGYEAQSRIRMRNSGSAEWVLRASNPDPVEGKSEIDVAFEHDQYLIYVEAKLGSDISMDTKYDLQRNQIARNIDCLIANSARRLPIFWMLVRDEAPDRAYVQLITAYKSDPKLLARDLPHREQALLNIVAQNLTILLTACLYARLPADRLVCRYDGRNPWTPEAPPFSPPPPAHDMISPRKADRRGCCLPRSAHC